MNGRLLYYLVLLIMLGPVSLVPVSAQDDSLFIKFSDVELQKGRQLWLTNCKGCHAYGVADAPVPMRASEWMNRVNKPGHVLYDHAINGFFGPDDTMMPARGGNPELSDRQVKLAVDYMVALAKYYIGKH